MIIVIADDITGAAEVAGVCLRYQLKVLFSLDGIPTEKADIVVIVGDSRSAGETRAAEIHAAIANDIFKYPVDWIFKKCDSVLRGYVTTEISQLASLYQVKKPVIVPVNPATGRIIHNGQYYINDIPLHETAFSKDPDFPATTSQIFTLITERNTSAIPFEIPDCRNQKELIHLAGLHQNEIIFTGSSAWFHEILIQKKKLKRKDVKISSEKIKNFIVFNGSLHPSGKDFLNTFDNQYPVETLPVELYKKEIEWSEIEKFQEKITHQFHQAKGLFLFQNPAILQHCKDVTFIINRTLIITEKIFQSAQVQQIMITGGATAIEILNHLKIKVLIPDKELAPGVINFKIADDFNRKIALKPGSYPWGVKFV